MDSHLAVLLDAIREHRESGLEEDDVYVWWGKLRSPHRLQDLPHMQLIDEIAAELDAPGVSPEVQLYLTDYRSLYVGQLTRITRTDIRDLEPLRVPEYIRRRKPRGPNQAKKEPPPYAYGADCWFKLGDVRRLVLDDTVGVVQELALLGNTRYQNQPVSLYGGMLDLPLIVIREDGRCFFSPEERDHLSERKWWAELDAERGRGIAKIEQDLRDNVLGEPVWSVFDPTARAFLADGERVFREHRRDAAFDYSPVILNFAKAIEVHFRWLVRSAIASSPGLNSVIEVQGEERDLLNAEMPTLGQLAFLIKEDEAFRHILMQLINGDSLIKEFIKTLDKLTLVRNKAAHDERIDLATATEWRNSLLGVGCPGLIEELAKVRSKRPAAR